MVNKLTTNFLTSKIKSILS